MTGALIILAVTVLAGIILRLTHRPDDRKDKADDRQETSDTEAEVCCGLHAVCEKGLSPDGKAVYFDDEELDRFAGREPDSYTTDEINEFREVLYTLGATEVYAWGSALTQRDIALPLDLRDEWVMLCG